MIVTFSWPKSTATPTIVNEAIRNIMGSPTSLLGEADDREGLLYEIPGLAIPEPMCRLGSYRTYLTRVQEVCQRLGSIGITAEILIDGKSILEYAADQEGRFTFLGDVVRYRCEDLKGKRKWVKDEGLVAIRHFLEIMLRQAVFMPGPFVNSAPITQFIKPPKPGSAF